MLRTKSVKSPINPSTDGLRILATRFRGRGMKANRYHVWMPNLGPSEKLLRGFQAGRITWNEYVATYKKELLSGGQIDSRNTTIKNHGQKFTLRLLRTLSKTRAVTLLCHCAEEQQHCHRHLLKKLIKRI